MASGPSHPPLWHKTLGQLVDEQAALHADRPAIISSWQSSTVSYGKLADRSQVVAQALYNNGLRHGDSIGILAGNRIEYLETFVGAARLGCPLVVINNTYTSSELLSALSKSNCKLLFVSARIGSRDLRDHIEQIMRPDFLGTPSIALELIVLLDTCQDDIKHQKVRGYLDFLHTASSPEGLNVRRAKCLVKPEDVVNLQFTSGTTGAPKAAELTHINVLNNGRFVGARMALTPDDVVCCPPPLFHCFGLVIGFLACLSHGSAILFASETFHAEKVVRAIFDEKASVLLSVPTMFVAELDVIRRNKRKPLHLRCLVSAGSALSTALAHQIHDEMGVASILICYGMTETSPVSFMTSMEDPTAKKLTTLGKILPHTHAKVIHSSGEALGANQRGELCTTGFGLQRGYYMNAAKTQEVMRTDHTGTTWMHTGDEVMIDSEGYLILTGRIKDIIIRGGENIFPGEIEDRLAEHQEIAEVSVVRLLDERYGEIIAAFIRYSSAAKLLPSDAKLRQWVGEKLGRHKAPAHFFRVGVQGLIEDFPKTGSGKHQKHILRDIGNEAVATAKRSVPKL